MIILDLQSHPSEVLHSYQESRTRTKTRFLSCSQGFLSSLLARFEVALFFHFCYLRARSWNRMPLLGSTDWVAVLSSLLEHQLLTDPFFLSSQRIHCNCPHVQGLILDSQQDDRKAVIHVPFILGPSKATGASPWVANSYHDSKKQPGCEFCLIKRRESAWCRPWGSGNTDTLKTGPADRDALTPTFIFWNVFPVFSVFSLYQWVPTVLWGSFQRGPFVSEMMPA